MLFQEFLCDICLGCNKLEDENFKGEYECNNFVKDEQKKSIREFIHEGLKEEQ